MTIGVFRDGHPRLTIYLPLANQLTPVEFIVDTGFEGDLALPSDIARQLDADQAGSVLRMLADGVPYRCPALELDLDNDILSRMVEVLVLPGAPLLGTTFLQDCQLSVEVVPHGEVHVSPM